MNETPEDQKMEPAAHAPFRLSCTCGADINAPDRPFTLGPIALVSHANHALIWLRCQTCKADHELMTLVEYCNSHTTRSAQHGEVS